ncbi:hypothetical protein BDV25DRAFT_108802 [Aspergillus avenaceus]|uniref:Uncharacterized protein n=1 Tax=Aspergillus avenaceus TaxID=36643 RepID=A0A5N6TWW7_ASPAV|nr:hypothetical protein BDV25DRAFT_108802 [Aspergillus avenaceus]
MDDYWWNEDIEDLPWDNDVDQPEESDGAAQSKLRDAQLKESAAAFDAYYQNSLDNMWDEWQQDCAKGNAMFNNVYHPPPGVSFRLCHYKLDQCIYARDHNTPNTGRVWRAGQSYPDQYFHLVYDMGGNAWAFKNAQTGKYLAAGPQANSNVGHTPALGDKTRVFLQPVKNKKLKGYFKIIFDNDDFQSMLTLSDDHDTFYTVPTDQAETEHHYWYMEYEDMEFFKIEWDDTKARIGSQEVVSLWSESFMNESNVTQQSEINEEQSIEQTSEFGHLFGASIGASVEAKVGLPFVAGATVTASASANTELKWNKISKWDKKYSLKTTFNWPANSYMKGSIVVRKGTIDMPFMVKYKSVSTGEEICSWGLWRGVMSYDQARRLVKA